MSNLKLNINNLKLKRFTLMELMAVIAIIGILVTMVLSNVGGGMDKADALTVKADLKAVAEASKAYELMYGVEPNGLPDDLETLMKTLKADSDTCGSGENKNPKRRKFLDSKILLKEGEDVKDGPNNVDRWGGIVTLSGTSTTGYTLTSPGTGGVKVVYTWE